MGSYLRKAALAGAMTGLLAVPVFGQQQKEPDYVGKLRQAGYEVKLNESPDRKAFQLEKFSEEGDALFGFFKWKVREHWEVEYKPVEWGDWLSDSQKAEEIAKMAKESGVSIAMINCLIENTQHKWLLSNYNGTIEKKAPLGDWHKIKNLDTLPSAVYKVLPEGSAK